MRLIDIDIFPLLPNKLDGDESEYERGYHDATDNLKALPLVDAVPVVRGEWIEAKSGVMSVWPEGQVMCSVCKQRMPLAWKRCAILLWVGAKMETTMRMIGTL